MVSFREIDGDLIKLALNGEFDVIAHGCNCFCTMGAGIAPQMARAFGCDTFKMEHKSLRGDINKLGTIDYATFYKEKDQYGGKWVRYIDEAIFMTDKKLVVVNAYTQYNYGTNHSDGTTRPFDYDALKLCIKKINHIFKGKHLGLPMIGAGLAGGKWSTIEKIIYGESKDIDVTIVKYNKHA